MGASMDRTQVRAVFVFFFQAEDGIRDYKVTGVQTCALPIWVLVFAAGEKAREATEAGADYVGGDDLVKRIQEGWLDFDVALATPDMMGQEIGRASCRERV